MFFQNSRMTQFGELPDLVFGQICIQYCQMWFFMEMVIFAILPKTTSGSSSKCATDQIQSYHISKIFNTDNLLLNSSIKIGNLYIIINDFFPSNRSFIKENGDSFYFSPAIKPIQIVDIKSFAILFKLGQIGS